MIEQFGPFDCVFDVGGNIGEFAEACKQDWPQAQVTSFEPVPKIARENERRAKGRWWVEPVGLSSSAGLRTMRFCVNQHSASTMAPVGDVRASRFGITDLFEDVQVQTRLLDDYRHLLPGTGAVLVKIDVEGHELEVLKGGPEVLRRADVLLIEVNQDPDVFLGAPSPLQLSQHLRPRGFLFAGVAGVQLDPQGRLVQFDGIWCR